MRTNFYSEAETDASHEKKKDGIPMNRKIKLCQ